MAPKQTADVVLKLLDKVPDAGKLDKLLEAENLLKLLQRYGQSKDDVRRKLTNGVLPGELLLELLEQEPDPDRLLAQLGISDAKSEKSNIKQDQPNKARMSASSATKPERPTNLFGNYFLPAVLVIIGLTTVAPALMVTGFLPGATLTREAGTLIALVGGAVAGAIANPKARLSPKGMMVGAVYGLGTLWATILYTQARTSIIKIELIIPLGLGIIPAFAVYYVLSQVFHSK
jgi:hypothetical protein